MKSKISGSSTKIPVLMVSLKTWPQVGFSRNRSMDPSSWVMTMPNSSGSSTAFRAMVARAPLASWKSTTRGQVDVGEDVARDDDEPLVELVPGVQHRPGRAERGGLGGVDHADPELRAVAEIAADGVGHEGDRDHDVLEAVLAQQADDVLHHGPVGHGQHRLRLVRGEGAEAGALAAGHDQRFHGSISLRTYPAGGPGTPEVAAPGGPRRPRGTPAPAPPPGQGGRGPPARRRPAAIQARIRAGMAQSQAKMVTGVCQDTCP